MTTAEKLETKVTSNVETLKSVGVKSGSTLVKGAKGVAGAAKFGWHTWLGAALTIEEKTTSLAKSLMSDAAKKSVEFAKKGTEFEEKALSKVTGKLTKTKGQVSEQLTEQTSGMRVIAQNKISNVETMLDKGVNRSLHMLGVPTKHDVRELTSLMKDMSDAITDLSAQSSTAKAKRATKTAEMN